jgi:P pilus assembly chaperone PapD
MRFIRTIGLAITMLTLVQATATAGVIIGGADHFRWCKKEASISVNNPDATPYLIQSWIDDAGRWFW